MRIKGEVFMQKGKILSLEDRIPKIKEHRKRKANRRLIFLLSLFFLLIVCVLYFQSPLSQIKRIDIHGIESVTKNEALEKSGLKKGLNLWKIDKKKAAANLSALPEIKSADVKWIFPNIIQIDIEEYAAIAYISAGSDFHSMLENGEILTKGKKTMLHSGAPILVNFKAGDVLNEMAAALSKLPEEILNAISEIHYEPKKTDRYHIQVFMNDGYEVNATILTFSDKMVHYPSIISQLDPNVKGVIDLEVGSYFRAYESEGDEQEGTEEKDEE